MRYIHLRGTSEVLAPGGPSQTLIDGLDRALFEVVTPSYPASYGAPVSFAESNMIGRAAVLKILRSTTGSVVLSGYSAGAYIMGDLARDIALSRVEGVLPSRIVGVVLLADPKRPEGAGVQGVVTPRGYGIAGQRSIPDLPVFSAAAPHDPIAALAADSPLRSVADLTAAFTASPAGWDEWARDMYDRLVVRRDLQLWWRFGFRPQRWGQAAEALAGYLFWGFHTLDYTRLGICQALADTVNREVR